MQKIIVNSTVCVLLCAGLMACGQKGALYLPTQPEAAGRATLPQTLLPWTTHSSDDASYSHTPSMKAVKKATTASQPSPAAP